MNCVICGSKIDHDKDVPACDYCLFRAEERAEHEAKSVIRGEQEGEDEKNQI